MKSSPHGTSFEVDSSDWDSGSEDAGSFLYENSEELLGRAAQSGVIDQYGSQFSPSARFCEHDRQISPFITDNTSARTVDTHMGMIFTLYGGSPERSDPISRTSPSVGEGRALERSDAADALLEERERRQRLQATLCNEETLRIMSESFRRIDYLSRKELNLRLDRMKAEKVAQRKESHEAVKTIRETQSRERQKQALCEERENKRAFERLQRYMAIKREEELAIQRAREAAERRAREAREEAECARLKEEQEAALRAKKEAEVVALVDAKAKASARGAADTSATISSAPASLISKMPPKEVTGQTLEALAEQFGKAKAYEEDYAQAVLPKLDKSHPSCTPTTLSTKRSVQRTVRSIVNKLSDDQGILEEATALVTFVREVHGVGEPLLSRFTHHYLAESLIRPVGSIGSVRDEDSIKKVFPLAFTIVVLCAKIGKELLTGQSVDDYKRIAGFKELKTGWELVDRFQERMAAHVCLYAAVLQTDLKEAGLDVANPHGIARGWRWLARMLNQKPNHYSPGILASFLKVAGFSLYSTYGRQFVKAMHYVLESWLAPNREAINNDADICVLSDWIMAENFREPPSGKYFYRKPPVSS